MKFQECTFFVFTAIKLINEHTYFFLIANTSPTHFQFADHEISVNSASHFQLWRRVASYKWKKGPSAIHPDLSAIVNYCQTVSFKSFEDSKGTEYIRYFIFEIGIMGSPWRAIYMQTDLG